MSVSYSCEGFWHGYSIYGIYRRSSDCPKPKPEYLKHASSVLASGNLRLAVTLPEGEDLNEWLAVNSKWRGD